MVQTSDIQMVRPEVSFRGSKHHPYYIWSEDYLQQSSGSRVTYILCHILNEMGFEAYITSASSVPHYRTPQLTFDIRNKHQAEGRHPIAVYTEIVEGNPLDGEVVVRWVNNRMGNVGVPIEFNENDLVFYFAHAFTASGIIADSTDILAVAGLFDESIFNKDDVKEDERNGFCYYAHKYIRDGHGVVADRIKDNGISLCQDIPRTHQEIADILKRSKVLYSYESGAIMHEARLCGCPVVLIGTDYLYNNYSVENSYTHSYWYCFQNEQDIDINEVPEGARVNKDEIIGELRKDESSRYESVNRFATITQEKAQRPILSDNKHGSQEIVNFCSSHNKVYIYGGGSIARNCYNVLMTLGIQNVMGFVVSDGSKKDEKCFNKPVYEFSWMPDSPQVCGIILAMRICFREEVLPSLEKANYDYMHYCVKPR